MDVVREQGEVIHAVLMFDEIATEKRIRLDVRMDVFLGVCREHGHRTSLEFNTEEDLKELFCALDNGEVHYAAEVRSSFIYFIWYLIFICIGNHRRIGSPM